MRRRSGFRGFWYAQGTLGQLAARAVGALFREVWLQARTYCKSQVRLKKRKR